MPTVQNEHTLDVALWAYKQRDDASYRDACDNKPRPTQDVDHDAILWAAESGGAKKGNLNFYGWTNDEQNDSKWFSE